MKNTIVTILTVHKREAACFIKEKLEFEGIKCFLIGESFDNKKEKPSDIRKIKVNIEDTEKAVKVMLDIHDKYDLDKIKKEDCLTNMQKILVPIDLSNYAINVCKYAVEMAKKINAEVKFLYVYKDPSDSGNIKHTSSWEEHSKIVSEQTFKEAQKKLVKFTKKMEKEIPEEDFIKVRLHYSLQKGEPVHVIKAISEKYKPHLILLGTKGQHDKKSIFIGSVTTNVIENANFPILTVPKAAILQSSKLKIMYATNFKDSDNKSLNTLLKIIEPFDTEIHCIHIDTEEDSLKQEKITELNNKLKKNYPNINIQYNLFENKNLLKGFENFIKEQNIDIVSFSSPKRNLIYKIFNSNKLKKMVAVSKIPMLIFRV